MGDYQSRVHPVPSLHTHELLPVSGQTCCSDGKRGLCKAQGSNQMWAWAQRSCVWPDGGCIVRDQFFQEVVRVGECISPPPSNRVMRLCARGATAHCLERNKPHKLLRRKQAHVHSFRRHQHLPRIWEETGSCLYFLHFFLNCGIMSWPNLGTDFEVELG